MTQERKPQDKWPKHPAQRAITSMTKILKELEKHFNIEEDGGAYSMNTKKGITFGLGHKIAMALHDSWLWETEECRTGHQYDLTQVSGASPVAEVQGEKPSQPLPNASPTPGPGKVCCQLSEETGHHESDCINDPSNQEPRCQGSGLEGE